ncbi:hypothetical protein [Lentibacillus cibarius]|uniref:DUF4190 domain-containing protein n=1 Tax=Lentibacillus cibarius TaxID=2583219 RepID=A0A5S3QKS1_9BACI|nr:hypothetical protein [Lentibacillus cibarius]TMN21801.1 hypothetical protein FFL34_06510 [Lentibacillus cibarius]
MSEVIAVEQRSNTAAVVSISLAILGFVFSLIPLFGWLLLPVWILAIVIGIIGLFKQYNRGFAIFGIGIGLFTFIYKFSFLQALFG